MQAGPTFYGAWTLDVDVDDRALASIPFAGPTADGNPAAE
jgi:hypothetical protein